MKYNKEDEARELIKSHDMLGAIKLIRNENVGFGLREAKDLCEKWKNEMYIPPSSPRIERKDLVVTDFQRMDYLESLFASGDLKKWTYLMSVVAVHGFRRAIDMTRSAAE